MASAQTPGHEVGTQVDRGRRPGRCDAHTSQVDSQVEEVVPERQGFGSGQAFTQSRPLRGQALLVESALVVLPCLDELEESVTAEVDDVELLDLGRDGVDAHAQEVLRTEVAESTNDRLDRLGDSTTYGDEIGIASVRTDHLDVEADAAGHGREASQGEGEDLGPVLGAQGELNPQIRATPAGRDDEIEEVLDVLVPAMRRTTVIDSEFCEAVRDSLFQHEPSFVRSASAITHETLHVIE